MKPQDGLGEVKKYKLGDAPSFYYSPRWSPDGKRIAYSDKRKQLWYIDLDSGKSTKVDTDPMALAGPPSAEWSPDSKWIAYVRSLKSAVGAVFLYSLETGKAHQITDGMSDARTATFDKNGKYLYFLASTDSGPVTFGSMASFNRARTSAAYVVVLEQEDPSPLLPESDDEQEGAADKPAREIRRGQGQEKDEKEKKEPPESPGRSREHRPADPGPADTQPKLYRPSCGQGQHVVCPRSRSGERARRAAPHPVAFCTSLI